MSKSVFGLILLCLASLSLRAEQPTFTLGSADVNPGEMVEINVTVDNYSDIVSTQFSVNWDPAVLEFVEGKNFNASLPGLSSTALGVDQIALGKLHLIWFEASITPVTIPDGSIFFTIVFQVVGDPCDNTPLVFSNDPTAIEVGEGVAGIDVGLIPVNGEVSVNGTGCAQTIQLTGNNVTGDCGGNACIQFAVQNFTDVAAMEFSLFYDPAVLTFDKFQNFAQLQGFNSGSTNLLSPGTIRVVWTNPNANNESLPDGTILFDICFDVIGTTGQSSQINFGNNPLPVFSDENNNVHITNMTPATITAQCALQGFALIAETVCTQPGEIVCMDIKVNDFDEMVAMGFSMNWDSTRFRFHHLEGFNLEGLSMDNFGTPTTAIDVKEGQITVVWIDLTLQGVTVPDLTTIFTLCLEAVGQVGSSTAVNFTGNPNAIEILNAQDSLITPQLLQGQAQIKTNCDPGPCDVSYTLTTVHPNCPGDCNGVLNLMVTVSNCSDTPTYLWSTNETTEDITGKCAGIYCVTITVGSRIIIACDTLEDPDPFSVTSNITNPTPISASNGSIDITVTGGTPPYSYVWSTPPGGSTQDLDSIPVGTYTVTIIDNNGCQFVPDPFVVGAEVSANITHVSCNGQSNGVIDLSVSFGTGPYTYNWNTTPPQTTQDLTGLAPGMYCVTVTDSGGETRNMCFTVNNAPAINITATITHDVNLNCQGAIDLNVTGGALPYTYDWSNSATTQDILGLCGGQYCVTVTDGLGCTNDTCFIVNGNYNVSLSALNYGNFQTSCNGICDGQITSTVTGGTGTLTYLWSNAQTTPNLSNVCAGTYGLTVTDASGATVTASIVLSSAPAITINVTPTLPTDIGSFDGAVTASVTGGTPGYTYSWTGPVSGNTPTLSGIPGGTYTLVVTDANGCQNSAVALLIPDGEPCFRGIRIITPNQDGRNDFFIMTCVLDLPNHLSIFNRQGGLVYETNNYQNNWDGVDQSDQDLPDGGYLWVLEVTFPGGLKQIYKGAVNVLRTAD